MTDGTADPPEGAPPCDLLEEQGRVVEGQLRELDLARRPPWSYGAWALCAVHCAVLAGGAALLSLLRPREVPWMCRELGRRYWYVAEMGIHKGVEISALARDRYGGRGVDLGCGDGIVGGILQRACGLEPMVGVDLLEWNEAAVLGEGYASFHAGSLDGLPLEDSSFDYAVSICVVEHLPDLEAALLEVGRVLRPGGTFHFTTPAPRFPTSTLGYRFFSALGLGDRAARHRRDKDAVMLHYRYLSAEEWNELLGRCGFEEVVVRPIFSRFQHLVYEVMGLQIDLMRLYFADRLRALGTRWPLLQGLMAWATGVWSAQVALAPATDATATHFHVCCRRKARSS